MVLLAMSGALVGAKTKIGLPLASATALGSLIVLGFATEPDKSAESRCTSTERPRPINRSRWLPPQGHHDPYEEHD
ncbi:MAG: hypothetical protein ACI9VR_004756 [Cognaticolwellia sp.]|jgi:hypothetical protein